MDDFDRHYELKRMKAKKIAKIRQLEQEIEILDIEISRIKTGAPPGSVPIPAATVAVPEQPEAAPTPQPAPASEPIAETRKRATLYLLDWCREHNDLSIISEVPSQQKIAEHFGVNRTSLFCPDSESGKQLIEYHRKIRESFVRDFRVRGDSYCNATDPGG